MNCFVICIAALLVTCAVDGSVIVNKTSPVPENSVPDDTSNKTAPTENTTSGTGKTPARRVTVEEVTTGNDTSPDAKKSLRVSVPHQFMRLLIKNESVIYAPLGSTVELVCLGTSSPPATMKWKFENAFITKEAGYPDQNDIQEVPIGQLMSRYRIGCLRAEHQGRYFCVGRTGTRVVTAPSVRILIGASNITMTKGPHDDGMEESAAAASATVATVANSDIPNAECEIHALTAPRVVVWGPTLLQFMGQDAKLPCEAVGNPTPTISWLSPEGTPVDTESKDSRFKQLSNGELAISKLEWGDMGTYFCVAANALGNDTAETFVYPTKRSPRFS